jgi:HPt (histidine-containing phosphotransfer) domain-containing protein
MTNIKEINVISGEINERNFNSEELNSISIAQEKQNQENILIEAKEIAKASALAKLTALGLTEEEVKSIL